MENFIIISLFGIICFILGWRMREYHATKVLERMHQKFANETFSKYKESVIDIRVEDHDGVFFVYKKEDNSFLAQGPTKESLEDVLSEKFPGKFFNASPKDLEVLNTR